MEPILHIRKHVFGVSQAVFAELSGVAQSTVSRWERGELSPTHDDLRRIRETAISRGVGWQDEWFFEVPEMESAE